MGDTIGSGYVSPADRVPFRWDEAHRIARTNPERMALTIDDVAMSFGEIVEGIDDRARWIREQVQITDSIRVLPVLIDQSFESALAILTCLWSEIPFALVDSEFPAARRESVLSLLTNPFPLWDARGGSVHSALDTQTLKYPEVSALSTRNAGAPGEALRAEIVMFTSGTTGFPKAVAMTRDTLKRRIEWLFSMKEIDAGCEFTRFSTSRFPNGPGLFQLAELLGGVSAVIVDSGALSPRQLLERMISENPTHVSFTPQLARVLGQLAAPTDFTTTRTVAVRMSGEATRFEHMHAISRFFPETAVFSHVYGSTEGSLNLGFNSTLAGTPPTGPVPLRIAYGADIVDFAPADEFLPGTVEVWASGDLAEGYVGNPELTSQRFELRNGKMWWRTGDLFRQVSDEEYIHVGRHDDIVKVSGYLVSTSEVETALLRDSEVFAGAVVDFPRGETTALAAFVVRTAGGDARVNEIRQRLSETIPFYMLPAQIHVVEKLPTTKAGKVDRVALRKIAVEGPPTEGTTA